MSVGRRTFVGLTSCALLAMGATPDARADLPVAQVNLPEGVHLASGGRYLKDMCSHKKRLHCLGEWLLPEGWRPGMSVPEGAVPLATPSGMGPADVLAAYNIPTSSAANGKIVAIVDQPTIMRSRTSTRTAHKRA